jgi:hypothetical protein
MADTPVFAHGVQEADGSNPVAPTIYINDLQHPAVSHFHPLSPKFNI